MHAKESTGDNTKLQPFRAQLPHSAKHFQITHRNSPQKKGFKPKQQSHYFFDKMLCKTTASIKNITFWSRVKKQIHTHWGKKKKNLSRRKGKFPDSVTGTDVTQELLGTKLCPPWNTWYNTSKQARLNKIRILNTQVSEMEKHMIVHLQEPPGDSGTLGWPQSRGLGAIWWPLALLLPALGSLCPYPTAGSACSQSMEKALGRERQTPLPAHTRTCSWHASRGLLRSLVIAKLCPSVSMTMGYCSLLHLLFSVFRWMNSSFPYAFHSLPKCTSFRAIM